MLLGGIMEAELEVTAEAGGLTELEFGGGVEVE